MVQQRAELFPGIVSGLNSLFSGLLLCGKRVCCVAGTRGHLENQALDTASVGIGSLSNWPLLCSTGLDFQRSEHEASDLGLVGLEL